tara:strand:- start:164 stop:316 length:153 start_codon:yes stop_codon:yes gene_type:complete
MLFTFNSFWKTTFSLAAGALSCVFIGFELTVVSLLVLLVCKNYNDKSFLI